MVQAHIVHKQGDCIMAGFHCLTTTSYRIPLSHITIPTQLSCCNRKQAGACSYFDLAATCTYRDSCVGRWYRTIMIVCCAAVGRWLRFITIPYFVCRQHPYMFTVMTGAGGMGWNVTGNTLYDEWRTSSRITGGELLDGAESTALEDDSGVVVFVAVAAPCCLLP